MRQILRMKNVNLVQRRDLRGLQREHRQFTPDAALGCQSQHPCQYIQCCEKERTLSQLMFDSVFLSRAHTSCPRCWPDLLLLMVSLDSCINTTIHTKRSLFTFLFLTNQIHFDHNTHVKSLLTSTLN